MRVNFFPDVKGSSELRKDVSQDAHNMTHKELTSESDLVGVCLSQVQGSFVARPELLSYYGEQLLYRKPFRKALVIGFIDNISTHTYPNQQS